MRHSRLITALAVFGLGVVLAGCASRGHDPRFATGYAPEPMAQVAYQPAYSPDHGVGLYGNPGARGGSVHYAAVGYGGRAGGAGRQTCPPGTMSMGQHGCAGQPITDPAVLQKFNESVRGPCVQGATRVKWVSGTDRQGRPVRWQVKQHAECGGQQ